MVSTRRPRSSAYSGCHIRASVVATPVRDRRGGGDDERLEYPVWRLPGMEHAEQPRYEVNRAAIALRDVKGVREVNIGRV